MTFFNFLVVQNLNDDGLLYDVYYTFYFVISSTSQSSPAYEEVP